MPFQMPLKSMRIRGTVGKTCVINNTFGMVRNQGTKAHQGWDLLALPRTAAFAITAGKIAYAGDVTDYGQTVVLEFQHEGRTLYALYGHLTEAHVKKNDKVPQGYIVGLTGRDGNAASVISHLHFEILTSWPPGPGLQDRIDPQEILGAAFLVCQPANGAEDRYYRPTEGAPAGSPQPTPMPTTSPMPQPTPTPSPTDGVSAFA